MSKAIDNLEAAQKRAMATRLTFGVVQDAVAVSLRPIQKLRLLVRLQRASGPPRR
jgi:hypothetical protein